MAVRYRKYFKECKSIQCNGRRSRRCPEIPKRSNNEYKTCGVWCIEFFDDRKEWQSLTFKDIRCKTEAEKRLALFISDRERGKLQLPKRRVIPTLTEYCQIYLELYTMAKENTLACKKRTINTLVKYLGNYRLDKITSFIIEKFRIERKEHDKVKDSSLNIDISVLSHVFNTAIKAGILDKNPCKDIKKLKVEQSRERILSNPEIAILLDKLHGKDRLMILTGLFTGMRLGEVLGLKWQDIDFDKGVIIFTQSKTGKLVTVPLSSYLAKELLNYRADGSVDRIYDDRKITHAIVNRYSNHFSSLFKQLGIYDFTYHSLRHSFSSLLQGELGVGAVVVQGMTGHSSLSMLQKYSHTGIDSKQRAIQALTDHVLNVNRNINKAVCQ